MAIPFIRLQSAKSRRLPRSGGGLSAVGFVLVAVFMGGGLAVFGRLSQAPEPPPPLNMPARSENLSQGGSVYRRACEMCHGEAGLGKNSLGPALLESIWLRSCSAEQLSAVLLHGVMGPIPGSRSVHPIMPGFGNWLSDGEVADVAAYTVRIWGRRHLPVSAQTVAGIRARHDKRQIPWTLAELQKHYPAGSTWPLASTP